MCLKFWRRNFPSCATMPYCAGMVVFKWWWLTFIFRVKVFSFLKRVCHSPLLACKWWFDCILREIRQLTNIWPQSVCAGTTRRPAGWWRAKTDWTMWLVFAYSTRLFRYLPPPNRLLHHGIALFCYVIQTNIFFFHF